MHSLETIRRLEEERTGREAVPRMIRRADRDKRRRRAPFTADAAAIDRLAAKLERQAAKFHMESRRYPVGDAARIDLEARAGGLNHGAYLAREWATQERRRARR